MNDYTFTKHAEMKMRGYGLSGQRVKRVIRAPKKKIEGVAPRTIAVMQPTSIKRRDGKETWSQEIWAMYQIKGKEKKNAGDDDTGANKKAVHSVNTIFSSEKIVVISAWRYPGMSKGGVPIPEDEELEF